MAKPQSSFRVFSIGFGGANLPMRDLQSNQVIGLGPEWVADSRSAPAAYPAAATPQLSVVFHASNTEQFPAGEAYTIHASGNGISVPPRKISLSLNPKKPISAPHVFPLSASLGGGIGIRTYTLKWKATDHHGQEFDIGTSTHTIYVTWRPAVDAVPPFEPVVRASVKAAAGKTTRFAIAEKLVKAIAGFNLGRSESGGSVRMVLLLKRADSSGFSALLNQMLTCQGIPAVTRAILVNFHKLPAAALDWVATGTAEPGVHCLTLIVNGSGVLLCDAESRVGPVALSMPLPPDADWTLTGAVFKVVLKDYLKPAAKRRPGLTKPMPPLDVPVTPFSVHFRYVGSQAIVLRDVVQDVDIGVTPEWVAGTTSFVTAGAGLGPTPAAFVRGTAITIEVTFLRTLDIEDGGKPQLTLTIGATGTPCGVTAQTVTLTFDADGRSDAHRFTLAGVVSNAVGLATLDLAWYVQTQTGQAPIGDSTHPLYFTWQAMTANPGDNLPEWAFAQVVKVTSASAAGATSARDVCDRIFRNLPAMGLKYGVPGWNTRQMLLGDGGMCGGWYTLFQTMAHSQGVFVERVGFMVDWRDLPGSSPATPQIQWNAIVVSKGGINQPSPTETASDFHDLAVFPIPSPAKLKNTTAARYRFWGQPGGVLDGHGINFLVQGGTLVLYDPSYMVGPIELTMALPPSKTVLGGADIAEFVTKYLTVAVSHMLGSFVVNGTPMTSVMPTGSGAGANGVSVVTSALPETNDGYPTVTFVFV